MSAVSCSEGVVDVAVGIGSQGLHELLLAGLHCGLGSLLLLVGGILGESAGLAFLLGIVAEILEKQGLTRLEGGCLLLGLLAVGSELDGNSEAL